MVNRLIDLAGKRFGRWEVLHRDGDTSPPMWVCVCDCGAMKMVRGDILRNLQSESCGCIGAERFKNLKFSGDNNGWRRKSQAKSSAELLPVGHPWMRRAQTIQQRCKVTGVKFCFASAGECAAYLNSISPERCPVFGFVLEAGRTGFHPKAPSADRKRPELGYVVGNLQVISMKANAMKAHATLEELHAFARWALGLSW